MAPNCPCMNFFGDLEFCTPIVHDGSKHPSWRPPSSEKGRDKGLKVNNSLTGQLEPFIPGSGNRVLWYTCGPTVYDACHMGHARAYLTLDIIRRIMSEYFQYQLMYHINITDIDDKIILRARQNHLLVGWTTRVMASPSKQADVLATVHEALDSKRASLASKRAKLEVPLATDATSRDTEEREQGLAEMALKDSQLSELEGKVSAFITSKQAWQDTDLKELIKLVSGELGELLDKREGDTVTDKEVFNKHARKFELAYLEDMDALGVRAPDVLTRVTEYVPEIIAFVEKIVSKGLAYEANGSVYLSIDAFKEAGHSYRKLKPFTGDTSEADMAEGEGAIGSDEGDKKNKNDFALWKKSKPGEPSWESPWGEGRPGWHIECSVIASDILGPNLDIHAGGVDLKFPHHDNELAQSEAYFGHDQWVNYFFHAGHLHIKGLKMSKSLKNFITIRQALEHHSARQIRLMFLLQPWDKPMNYSDQAVSDAKSKEALFRNFFGNVKALLTETSEATSTPSWLEKSVGWQQPKEDRSLAQLLLSTEDTVHAALCNNFDTPAVITALCELVSETNKYLTASAEKPAVYLLVRIATFITRILRVFGVVEGDDSIGFPLADGSSNREETLRPVLDAIKDFRQGVRNQAMGKDVSKAAVLGECDRVRDEVLPRLGVRLEDLSTGGSRWKYDDPAVLMREIEEKQEAEREARKLKRARELEKLQKNLSAARDAAIAPEDLLRATRATEFREFGDDGLPTQDAEGEPIAKAALKKLKKTVDGHKKSRD